MCDADNTSESVPQQETDEVPSLSETLNQLMHLVRARIPDDPFGEKAFSRLCSEAVAPILDSIGLLRELFESKIQSDEIRERAYEKLYRELEMYKDDFVERRMRETYTDLLLFYDSMQKEVRLAKSREERSEDSTNGEVLEHLLEELMELISRRGLDRIDTTSNRFDSTCQRAVRVVSTSRPDEDGTVDHVVKDGFTKDGKVIRPQAVVVRRFEQTVELSSSADA